MPDTPDLPRCKLCKSMPDCGPYRGSHWARCNNPQCLMSRPAMSLDNWRTLMGAPVVTDAMVERAHRYLKGHWSELATRAMLEAALGVE